MIPIFTVPVSLAERSYEITICSGLLGRLGRKLKQQAVKGKVAVVTDRRVARHYLRSVSETIKGQGIQPVPIILNPGERSKTLKTVESVLDVLARHRFERSSMMLALGGGGRGRHRGIFSLNLPTWYLLYPSTHDSCRPSGF